MMPPKLTQAMLDRIRSVEALRKTVPTRQKLANELGVSKSLVDRAVRNCNQVVRSIETTTELQNERVQECLVELGMAKP